MQSLSAREAMPGLLRRPSEETLAFPAHLQPLLGKYRVAEYRLVGIASAVVIERDCSARMNIGSDGSRVGRDPPGPDAGRVTHGSDDAGRRDVEWGREAMTGTRSTADRDRSVEGAVGCARI